MTTARRSDYLFSVTVVAGPRHIDKSRLMEVPLISPLLAVPVTYTTRPLLESELDEGVKIRMTGTAYREREARGQFLTSTEIDGHMYGRPVEVFDDMMSRGADIVLFCGIGDVDGTVEAVRGHCAANGRDVSVNTAFLTPPSLTWLRDRLFHVHRYTGTLAEALVEASEDMDHAGRFDFRIDCGSDTDIMDSIRVARLPLLAERSRRFRTRRTIAYQGN